MRKTSPQRIEEELTSDSAKDAFERINSLEPSWRVGNLDGQVYISASLGTKRVGSSKIASVQSGCAGSFDRAVMNLESDLLDMASDEDMLVVVDSHRESRKEFTYDESTGEFSPYEPK